VTHGSGDLAVPVRTDVSAGLSAADLSALHELFQAAWPAGNFDDHDFDHALGGRHWLVEIEGRIVSHASVVARTIWVGGQAVRTGYVEAVATLPAFENRGLGSVVVRGASDHIRATYELGALSTGRHAFYERLGWQTWLGPTFVRLPRAGDGDERSRRVVRTPDDDGTVLVLTTPTSPVVDLAGPLICDWREGDVW
jgi:aminoglycoside 2'-N-acetyltransferase I